MSEEHTVSITMYYSVYNHNMGYGFCPYLTRNSDSDVEIVIQFTLDGFTWVQSDNLIINNLFTVIDVLDIKNGRELLDFLNTAYFTQQDKKIQDTLKMCISSMKTNKLTDKVLSTSLNDLSKGEFIYRVIDEMVSCCWKQQAEYIVSLKGFDRSLTPTHIRSNNGILLYPKLVRKNGRTAWS